MATGNRNPATPPSEYYCLSPIPGKGLGCVALQPIQRGTRILADDPLLIVPQAKYLKSDIEAAFEPLSPEQKALYFSLHSGHGQDPKQWPSQIHSSVHGKERQRIQEQHDARLSASPSLISIFQTNCMEWNDGAAVFPHAARFNHSCTPNACFHWNEAIGKETIHVINHVSTGEEITLSYCDPNHDRTLRAWELRHYGFVCHCRACVRDEDDETSFAHETASRRFRLVELERETRFLRGQNLHEGAKRPDLVRKLLQLAALYQQESNVTSRLAGVFMDIALICKAHGDLSMAKAAAEKAIQVKKDCQGADFPDFHRYTDVLHHIHQQLAWDPKV